MKLHAIGPIVFDQEKQTVTLTPAVYTLTKPITFGYVEEITGIEMRPLEKEGE